MAAGEVIDDSANKVLCHHCVGENYLSTDIKEKGEIRECSYCGRSAATQTIQYVAERVELAFEQHYTRTADQPSSEQLSLLSDSESDYDWEREGEPVVSAIMEAANISGQVANDIQAILCDKHSSPSSDEIGEETEFSSETHYEEKGASDHAWQEEWRNFGRSLKTETRFFSRSAAAHLSSIFSGVDKMSTNDGRPLAIDAGAQTGMTAIFRARVFQSEEKLSEALCRPDLYLGSPPSTSAAAGRMNARGISVFYGASTPEVAIAEVRPPVGSRVVVASFEILRPLRLLDLTALNDVIEIGSVFDPNFAARRERITFLRSLSRRMSSPVMPDDEALEYIPTQAIADFLATENAPVFDGIVFPSVQANASGLNIVLFHKAARIEEMTIPEGTEIQAYTGWSSENGWESDYWVREEGSSINSSDEVALTQKYKSHASVYDGSMYANGLEGRVVTLRPNLQSIAVHEVLKVEFQYDSYNVRRHRWSKSDNRF